MMSTKEGAAPVNSSMSHINSRQAADKVSAPGGTAH